MRARILPTITEPYRNAAGELVGNRKIELAVSVEVRDRNRAGARRVLERRARGRRQSTMAISEQHRDAEAVSVWHDSVEIAVPVQIGEPGRGEVADARRDRRTWGLNESLGRESNRYGTGERPEQDARGNQTVDETPHRPSLPPFEFRMLPVG